MLHRGLFREWRASLQPTGERLPVLLKDHRGGGDHLGQGAPSDAAEALLAKLKCRPDPCHGSQLALFQVW